MRTLFKGFRIVGREAILSNHYLVVRGGYIEEVREVFSYRPGDYDQLIEGGGRYLAPGLIDIHCHGARGQDIVTGGARALESLSQFQLEEGVTSFLATIMSSPKRAMLQALLSTLNYRPKKRASSLLGVHLEGPFFNPERRGAQPEENLLAPSEEFIGEFLDLAGDRLRIVSLAPELEGGLEMVDYLKKRGVIVAMGHSSASFEEAEEAIARGASLATHLFNGMESFHHRRPGLVGAGLVDDRVYCEIIYDGVHLHHGAVSLALKAKGPDRIILVSDAMEAAGLGDGFYELAGKEVEVKSSVARLRSGALAGSTASLLQGLKNLVVYQKLPLYEAVKMASLNPASLLGLSKLGSLERGKIADMIVLDESISVKEVYQWGKRQL